MNNYDMSSTGENIEFWCYYDNDLSSTYYNDFVEHEAKRLDMGRDSALFLVGDCTRPHYTKAMLKKLSKQELYDLCQDYDLLGWQVSLDDYKRCEYEADLLGVTIEQHYRYLIAQHTWHGLGEAIPHDWYISRGYSQGDAVYVVSVDEPLTAKYKAYVDHVLWDSPISIRAEVNGDEFYEECFLTDQYEWDERAVKEKIKTLPISDYAKGFLIDNVPDYPKYL